MRMPRKSATQMQLQAPAGGRAFASSNGYTQQALIGEHCCSLPCSVSSKQKGTGACRHEGQGLARIVATTRKRTASTLPPLMFRSAATRANSFSTRSTCFHKYQEAQSSPAVLVEGQEQCSCNAQVGPERHRDQFAREKGATARGREDDNPGGRAMPLWTCCSCLGSS